MSDTGASMTTPYQSDGQEASAPATDAPGGATNVNPNEDQQAPDEDPDLMYCPLHGPLTTVIVWARDGTEPEEIEEAYGGRVLERLDFTPFWGGSLYLFQPDHPFDDEEEMENYTPN
ncbi:hypothetical protein Dda_2832 [Drechslerella dactyloides]|uniref:Uncharacterized protein n=1 Tax=Drechslerella dactyloides TaxID=74499 RepID=A0AAD6NL82_DREDA|nr:hypothetical protein Dda_2832 [Drechslerella dactyloides]